MAQRVCPWWLGYVLVSPLRRFLEPPRALLAPHVAPGMAVVEPGCGMGFFTLELARLVGPSGKVVAVDLQPRMLAGLRRRAHRAGLEERIEMRLAEAERLGLDGLEGVADLAVALHVVHEVGEPQHFFAELARALKPGGRVLVVEPRRHVTPEEFEGELRAAAAAGFAAVERPTCRSGPCALLERPRGPA
jgi:ubiquinone/menaquinone biosynthesis C-methylase UbiE